MTIQIFRLLKTGTPFKVQFSNDPIKLTYGTASLMSKELNIEPKGLQASNVPTNLERERRKIAEVTIEPFVGQFHFVLVIREKNTELRRLKKRPTRTVQII